MSMSSRDARGLTIQARSQKRPSRSVLERNAFPPSCTLSRYAPAARMISATIRSCCLMTSARRTTLKALQLPLSLGVDERPFDSGPLRIDHPLVCLLRIILLPQLLVGPNQQHGVEGVVRVGLLEVLERLRILTGLDLHVAGKVVVGWPVLLGALAALLDHALDRFRLRPCFLMLAHLGERACLSVVQTAEPGLLLVLGQVASRHALVALLVVLHGLGESSVLQVDAGHCVPDEDLRELLVEPARFILVEVGAERLERLVHAALVEMAERNAEADGEGHRALWQVFLDRLIGGARLAVVALQEVVGGKESFDTGTLGADGLGL